MLSSSSNKATTQKDAEASANTDLAEVVSHATQGMLHEETKEPTTEASAAGAEAKNYDLSTKDEAVRMTDQSRSSRELDIK